MAIMVMIAVSVLLMLLSIIYVYHTKVLNAPKVYSDGFGYFAYLPAVIHGDFTFSFMEGWEHPIKLVEVEGAMLDKYPVGVAILEAPFFFAAHLVCVLKDMVTGSVSATGYSNLYQYAILFSGVFYWALGTWFLYRALNGYLHFSKKVSVLTCTLMTYATNLFHYASYDACFSHVFSYMLFNAFLLYLCWYEQKYYETDKTEACTSKSGMLHACVFGILAGLIFMVRNTNILFVLTYIFYGVHNLSSLKRRFLTVIAPRRAVPIILSGMVTILPQMAYWHRMTGKWFVYSYGGNEPFYWTKPELFGFLLGVRKGAFFWCPFLLIGIIGLLYAAGKEKKLFIGFSTFLVLIVYISSAWWCWWYGGSYGQRVIVDFMCIFAVFTAYLLQYFEEHGKGCNLPDEHAKYNGGKKASEKKCLAKRKTGYRMKKYCFVTFCVLCIIWNYLAMFAYWHRILPSDGATWETVKQIFFWVFT